MRGWVWHDWHRSRSCTTWPARVTPSGSPPLRCSICDVTNTESHAVAVDLQRVPKGVAGSRGVGRGTRRGPVGAGRVGPGRSGGGDGDQGRQQIVEVTSCSLTGTRTRPGGRGEQSAMGSGPAPIATPGRSPGGGPPRRRFGRLPTARRCRARNDREVRVHPDRFHSQEARRAADAADRREDFADHLADLRDRHRRRPTLITMLDRTALR